VNSGEIFGWIIMTGGTVAVICFIDFIQRNLPDTLSDEISDADTRTAALRNSLIDGGEKATAETSRAGEQRQAGRSPSVTNNQTQNQTTSSTHSIQPANSADRLGN
jgi:phage-related tail protein